jgi:hypothetical protein
MGAPFKGRTSRPAPKKRNAFSRRHLVSTYKSGLEATNATRIAEVLGPSAVQYETAKIRFTQPAKPRTYTPDFPLPNGIVIETKGLFSPEDRKKMVMVVNEHPGLDIRFVFTNPNAKLYKGSPTTYADWCVNNGFPYAKKEIPLDWLTEPADPVRIEALKAANKRKPT